MTTLTSVVVLEGASATQVNVDASPGVAFCDEILGESPRFVASWQDATGIVVLAGTRAQDEASLPPVQRLPPPSSHREPVVYGKAVAVRTDEAGDVVDLTLERYERLCAGVTENTEY